VLKEALARAEEAQRAQLRRQAEQLAAAHAGGCTGELRHRALNLASTTRAWRCRVCRQSGSGWWGIPGAGAYLQCSWAIHLPVPERLLFKPPAHTCSLFHRDDCDGAQGPGSQD